MKLRLVDGTWIQTDGSRLKRFKASEPSSSKPFATSNEILKLFQSLHLKQDQQLGLIQGLEIKFDNLKVKIDSEFIEIYQRLNTINSQLNQIQEQINPMITITSLVHFLCHQGKYSSQP